jgi:hypothetical protein
MRPATAAVANLPSVVLTAAQVIESRNGRPILSAWLRNASLPASLDGVDIAALNSQGELAAILYEKLPGELWPRTNFNELPER